MNTAGTSLLRGAFLMVSMRWVDRLIGLVSTIVLARLLVPADFGIIAMAALVIGLVDVLLNFGVVMALLQNNAVTQQDYDTAWTLRLLQTLFATAIVVAIAPWAANYFNEPRVTPVITWLALGFVFSGLENIGIVAFQKEMKFGSDFRFLFIKRIAGFIVTLTAVWILQSYWALVIGNLSGRMVGVIASYVMHPMRPRLSCSRFKAFFSVSQWLLVRGIGLYLQNRLHQIVVGRREDAGVLGAYTLANEFASLPTTELLAPINRVLFPAFVKVKHDLKELKRVFLLAQSVQILVGTPMAIGMALVANEIVLVVLGAKWLSAVPFLQIMAVVSFVNAIATSGTYVLLTLGHVRVLAMSAWLQAGIFAALVFLAFPHSGALGIAYLRVGVAIAGLLTFAAFVLRHFPGLRLTEIITSCMRPVLAVIVMSMAIIGLQRLDSLHGGILLIAEVFIGAVSYALTVYVLWVVTGKRIGAETYILSKIEQVRTRRLMKRQ